MSVEFLFVLASLGTVCCEDCWLSSPGCSDMTTLQCSQLSVCFACVKPIVRAGSFFGLCLRELSQEVNQNKKRQKRVNNSDIAVSHMYHDYILHIITYNVMFMWVC